MYIMQNSVCPPCGGGTLKCSCRKELGDQLQLVRSMLSEIAERSDTCHTMTDVTTIGDLRCECACGVQLVPETSAALFIKRTTVHTPYSHVIPLVRNTMLRALFFASFSTIVAPKALQGCKESREVLRWGGSPP